MARLLVSLLALLALLAAPAHAQTRVTNPHTMVELLAETAAPAPGTTLTLGVRFTPARGWHTYWENPGEAGIAPRLDWQLPGGARAAPPRFPVPEPYLQSGIMNHVYGGPQTLLVDVAVPAGLGPGSAFPVRLRADYLVCDESICIPETATLALDLRAGAGAPDPEAAPAFAAARAALPRPGPAAALALDGGRLVVAVPGLGPDVARAHLFPLADGWIRYAAPQAASLSRETLRLEVEAASLPERPAPPLAAVLRLERTDGRVEGLVIAASPGPVPAPGTPLAAMVAGPAPATEAAASPAGGTTPALLPALALALAGGLLLNLFPCVFPILGLKALHLARAGTSEAVARREALAYAAGVLAFVGLLGAAILAARAAGAQLGWAFQLTDPRAVLLLMLVVTAIALNLAGLFELRAGRLAGAGEALARRPGTAGAFWTGALAALVATPCTGPFMGAAIGAALVLPPAAGLGVFLALGLGLALPFLVLGFVPALRRRLPRPGSWMERLRRALAVPMLLTALWLAWVLGRQAGVDGMTLGLAAALALGVALWWLGGRQRLGRPAGLAPAGLMLAALAAGLVLVRPAPPAATRADTATAAAPLAATPFSPEALAAARAAGRPAFAYFTADWCITCKANERGVLSDPAVAAAFERAGVAVFVGDWTNGDPAITRYLASHGRAGVPLYVFQHADGRTEILPQILTAARLKALVADPAA
jgi:thiol:disulfide interchange protein/DsbC/DsbD-like thiol-disulfide interchange protein